MAKPESLNIDWQEPWYLIEEQRQRETYEQELKRELGRRHVLYGLRCEAVAQSPDDDVLFLVEGGPRLAVVHLVYSDKTEKDPAWPYTEIYASGEEFVAKRLLPDVADFAGEAGNVE